MCLMSHQDFVNIITSLPKLASYLDSHPTMPARLTIHFLATVTQ